MKQSLGKGLSILLKEETSPIVKDEIANIARKERYVNLKGIGIIKFVGDEHGYGPQYKEKLYLTQGRLANDLLNKGNCQIHSYDHIHKPEMCICSM